MARPLSSGIPPPSVVGKIIATIKSGARYWVPLVFLSLSLLYFLPMLPGKNIFVERDLAGFFLPPKYLWVSMVKSFRFPLWNPHNYSGIPLLATLQPGVFYPPHVLYLLLPFNVAWNWLIILHVCFAGISTYLLLLRLRASTVGAFVGGIVFMLSGYVISIHNLLTHLFAVPWFPLAMIGLLRYFETGGRKYLVFCAAILAVQFFAGAPEITIVTVMALCALTCFIDAFAGEVVPHADSIPARFKALGLTLVLFCLLVSVQALPFLELKAHSIRAVGLSYQEAVTWSFAWRDFIQFFVPDAFGYFSTVKKYWSNQSWLLTLYWGIAPFFLSYLYFISQDRRRFPFLALMFLSLLFALGGNTPAYRLLHLVPPFNSIRYPVKFIFLFLFLVALTAGLGMDVLKKGVFEKNPTIKRSISIAFYAGFVFVMLWGYISIFGSTVYNYFDAMGFKPDAYNNIAVNIHNIKRFLLFSFLFCILLLVYLRVRFKKTGLFLIVLIVSLDLFLANNGYYTAGSWKFYIGREEGREHSFLHHMAADGGTERYFVSFKTMNEFNHFPYDRAIMGPPYAALFGLYALGGMEVMRITHHEVFSRLVKDSQSLEEGKRYLAIAGARYIVTSYPLQDRDFALLKSIETGGKTAYLYEYRSCPGRFLLFGRIRTVEDDRAMIAAISDRGIDLQKELLLLSKKAVPYEERAVTGKVDLLSYEANKVRLACTADNDAFLYVSDTYYPGWKAAVDGTPTTLYRANLAFRAVLVPKGSHIVTFTYVPLSFYIGLIMTAIGLLACMCVVVRDRKRRRGVSRANVTRGYGILERFLAHKRAALADALIPEEARNGRVLDVGCGVFPLFLSTTQFSKKYGIDKVSQALSDNQGPAGNISLRRHDIEADPVLPFDDGYFDVVTMLAVFEHIAPDRLPMVISQVHRVLKSDGLCIITTPAPWSRGLLKLMARLWLVSPREIHEHRAHYGASAVSKILRVGGFRSQDIRHGYFELGLNLWLTARKQRSWEP